MVHLFIRDVSIMARCIAAHLIVFGDTGSQPSTKNVLNSLLKWSVCLYEKALYFVKVSVTRATFEI